MTVVSNKSTEHAPISLIPKRASLSNALIAVLLPLAGIIVLESFSRAWLGAALKWAVSRPEMLALNYLPLLGISLCLFIIVKNRARAAASSVFLLLCAVYGIINRYKLVYRSEPILFTDITQIGDAMATVTGLDFKLDLMQLLWVGLGFTALLALCLAFARGRQASRPLLMPIIGIALMLIPLIYTFELAGGSRIDIQDHANSEGSLYTAIALENNRRALMRPDYTEEDIRGRYRELEARAGQAGELKPNVIMVLSESFTDERFLGKYLKLTSELTPYYNTLMSESRHGRIYVPKIGGGTSETEFEVLTGIRSRYSINPYSMGLPPINSLASIFRQKGYESTAVHWYAGVYYNRYRNLKMEGFNAFYTTDTTDKPFEKNGMFVSDREHFTAVLGKLNETECRDFIFCLTMQNHGGYGYDDFRKTYNADVPFTNKLSDESEMAAANYCWLLRRSDEALAEFVEALRSFPEPTVLVYFGDHMPPLGAQAYSELGMPTSGDEAHMTPYFIWSNYKTLTGEENMYAYELGAHALTLAGENDDPYMSELERLRTLGTENDDTIEALSYDALFGKQYAYSEGGIHPECGEFEIGGKMTLDGFDAAVVNNAIYLRPRLADMCQHFEIFLNGKPCGSRIFLPSSGEIELQCVMRNSSGRVFNQSETLAYRDADALLEACGELPYESVKLWESDYEPAAEGAFNIGGCAVLVSRQTFDTGRLIAAGMGGERMSCQPLYGLKRANELSIDGEGHVYIALDLDKLAKAEGENLANAARRYLEEKDARLYVFED